MTCTPVRQSFSTVGDSSFSLSVSSASLPAKTGSIKSCSKKEAGGPNPGLPQSQEVITPREKRTDAMTDKRPSVDNATRFAVETQFTGPGVTNDLRIGCIRQICGRRGQSDRSRRWLAGRLLMLTGRKVFAIYYCPYLTPPPQPRGNKYNTLN